MCVPHRGHGFSPSCSHHLPDDWATVWGDDPVGGTVVGGVRLQARGPVAWRPPPAPWGGCAGSHIAGAQAEPCPTRAPSAHLSPPGEGVPLHRLSAVCVPDGSLRKAAPRRSDRASFFLNPCSVTLQGWWWFGGGCCWRSAPRRLPPCPPPTPRCSTGSPANSPAWDRDSARGRIPMDSLCLCVAPSSPSSLIL